MKKKVFSILFLLCFVFSSSFAGIKKIERYDPKTEKTNLKEVTFRIHFDKKQKKLKCDKLQVNNGHIVSCQSVPKTKNKIWEVSVDLSSIPNKKAGTQVKLLSVGSHPLPIDSVQHYNYRSEFMADVELYALDQNFIEKLAFINDAQQGSNNYNIRRTDGRLRVAFDEKIEVENNMPLESILENTLNGYIEEVLFHSIFIADDSSSFESEPLNNIAQGLTYNITFNNKVVDEWRNETNLTDYGWFVMGGLNKISLFPGYDTLTESSEGTFAITDIYPNPTTGRTEFIINVFEAGYLNVSIYNLEGSCVLQVIQNKFMNKGRDLRIPLTLDKFPNGTYNVVVSMGNDSISKQLIIVK